MSRPIIIDQPIKRKYKKSKRFRSRKTFTISEETLKSLDSIIERGDAINSSRAIDLAVSFYLANSGAVMVNLNPEQRAAFLRFSMSQGLKPSAALRSLVSAALRGGAD